MQIDANTIVTLLGLVIGGVSLWFSQKADRRASSAELRGYINEQIKSNRELFNQWRKQHEDHERELFAKSTDLSRVEAKLDYVVTGVDEVKHRLERDLGAVERRLDRAEARQNGIQAREA